MKIVYSILSLVLVIVLMSLLSYGMAPNTDSFQWGSLNPLEAVYGIVFTLCFGLGMARWLAILSVILLLFLLWRGLYLVLVRIFRR